MKSKLFSMHQSNILLAGIVIVATLTTSSKSVDLPRPEEPVFTSFQRMNELSTQELVSATIDKITGVFKVHPALRNHLSLIMAALQGAASNQIGRAALALLQSYREIEALQSITFKKAGTAHSYVKPTFMGMRHDGWSTKGGAKLFSFYCFLDGKLMFDQLNNRVMLRRSPEVSFRVSMDHLDNARSLVHEVTHVLRRINGTFNGPFIRSNSHQLTQKLYAKELLQHPRESIASPSEVLDAVKALWTNDEELEVITGRKLSSESPEHYYVSEAAFDPSNVPLFHVSFDPESGFTDGLDLTELCSAMPQNPNLIVMTSQCTLDLYQPYSPSPTQHD
jgi:hypothetical protein